MKHSLRFRITLILTISILALILLVWVSNELFLEDYYQRMKVEALSDSYYDVNFIMSSGVITDQEQLNESIEKTEESSGTDIYIISEISTFMGRSVLTYVYPLYQEMGNPILDSMTGYNNRYRKISNALQTYIFEQPDMEQNHFELLTNVGEIYYVYKLYDVDRNMYYIDLVGNLDNGYLVFVRANYENISESAEISSRFLAIVGICVLIIGSTAMFFISRGFTRPILELSEISDAMAALDFDRKYPAKRKDEIGKLGNSINSLSDKLKMTITELKAANLELQKDILQKNEVDEMRKEFLSSVSHELKTPIALIQGYAEGLQDNINDDPESRAFYCDVIIDEAQKMNSMVKKLLTLNEIEFGHDNLSLERLDIVELSRNICGSVQILIKQKNIDLVFNDPGEPLYVWADEGLIEEVLTNYLSNAINHVSGKNIIDITFTNTDNKIRVSVFNTGDNIPEEELDNIWIKFYKVDKARTREYGGSGIGLSIVKAIMTQHKQSCGVINHSAGVEFWFELDSCAVE